MNFSVEMFFINIQSYFILVRITQTGVLSKASGMCRRSAAFEELSVIPHDDEPGPLIESQY